MNVKNSMIIATLSVLILGVYLLLSSRSNIQYGHVYQIQSGFFKGCTGVARAQNAGNTVTLDTVVCVTNSLDIEIRVSGSDLVPFESPPAPFEDYYNQ